MLPKMQPHRAQLSPFAAPLAIASFAAGCSFIVNPQPQAPDFSDGGTGIDGSTTLDGGCVGDTAPVCVGRDLVSCVAGNVLRTSCPVRCVDGACVPMKASNVPDFLFPPSSSDDLALKSETPLQFSTNACTADFMSGQKVAQRVAGGPEVCVVSVRSFELDEDSQLILSGNLPFVLLAEEGIAIDGTLDAGAFGATEGPGGFSPGRVGENVAGDGAGGGQAGQTFTSPGRDDLDGGGGGGALCGTGGRGGSAGSGTVVAEGGQSGTRFGSAWQLEPIFGGSGGAQGRVLARGVPDGTLLSAGGGGGGAVQLSSSSAISISGTVHVGGGHGHGGSGGAGTGSNAGAGGGGGSGGAILIEAPSVSVTGVLSAAGGGGGSGGSQERAGNDGEDGRDAGLGMAPGGSSTGVGGAGGSGGGGASVDARLGASALLNGGGGGGSVGCILIRATDASTAGAVRANPNVEPAYRVLDLKF